jgi:hypothetical protein
MRTAVAVVGLVLLPALALSQEPVKTFDQLNTRVKVGDTVYVTDGQGRERQGKVRELSSASVTLENDGLRTFSASEVGLVLERAPDRLKNGALIGLGVGAGLGAGLVAVICSEDECNAAGAAMGFAAYAGIGAAIGTGIDALIPGKKRIVYRAPDGSPGARVMLAPVLTRHARGLALSVAF